MVPPVRNSATPRPQENVAFRGRRRDSHDARRWFDATSTAMITVDQGSGRTLDANAALLELLCWSREEILETSSWEVAPLDRVAPDRKTLRSLAGTGSIPDIGLMTRDGRRVHLEVLWDAWREGDAEVVTFQIRDVTERYQATQVRNQLESRARLSEKMEAITALAGHTAHKLNNLLSVILGYNEFALTRLRPGDPLLDDLQHVQRTGERAAALTSELLAFGRTRLLQPELLDLDSILLGLEPTLQRIAGDAVVTLLAPGAVGRTLADKAQIEQVLVALVDNARQAMPDGGTLTVGTSDLDLALEPSLYLGIPPGSYVVLTVRDTGIGMDATVRSRMFEPFFSTRGAPGLGLANVWGIIRQTEGHVDVHSQPGEGTTITVYLPRVLTAAPSPRSPVPVSAAGGTETVLLVEDEDGVRAVTSRMIASAGYEVLTAGSGAEALLLAERYPGPIHLVVTDLVMPHMSGEAFVSRLALIRPRTQVLYMSGFPGDTVHREGAARFLAKPFQPAQLTSTIRHILDEG